jgi:hypothetical protein
MAVSFSDTITNGGNGGMYRTMTYRSTSFPLPLSTDDDDPSSSGLAARDVSPFEPVDVSPAATGVNGDDGDGSADAIPLAMSTSIML